MKKMLNIPHRVDDYVCMWNGIEDLYILNTNEQLPPKFLFSLASFGSFCYLKTNSSEIKRMVAIGDGRTKQMYEFLAPIVGFDCKSYSYANFEKALIKAKSEIDKGFPCIIGAIDMCYLKYYPKLYGGKSIPFHYVMMVGYDDEEKIVYVSDCGREEIQVITYEDLQLAWNCFYEGLSKSNTLWTIRMNSTKNKYEIAKEALAKKCEMFLNPPVGFIGYRGFEKFINELPKWKTELGKEDYDKILLNLVQFFGTVPTVPNALQGIDEEDEMEYNGGFDKISIVLEQIGKEYSDNKMRDAAKIFVDGGRITTKIKDIIVDYLTDKEDRTEEFPSLFTEIKNIMIKGFEKLR